jgi:hypothetical protein
MLPPFCIHVYVIISAVLYIVCQNCDSAFMRTILRIQNSVDRTYIFQHNLQKEKNKLRELNLNQT